MFVDRADAGRRLGARLAERGIPDAVVLGLPRGGVVVAFYVAQALHAPLDVVLVRKLGVPWQPELAFGAISEGHGRIVDERIVRAAGLEAHAVAAVERHEQAELERRAARYRGHRRPATITGRTAVVVDDGIATGATARVACRAARARGARAVLLAVPVAPPEAAGSVAPDVDDFACLRTPSDFSGVGRWYRDFTPTTDDEVSRLLDAAARQHPDDVAEIAPPSDRAGQIGPGDGAG